jgi:hypothetical protein
MFMNTRECKSCNEVFKVTGEDDLCPECGCKEKVDHYQRSVEEVMVTNDRVAIDMENVLTGRYGQIYHSESNTIHDKVKEFVEYLVNTTDSIEEVSEGEFAQQILSECQAATKLGLAGTYYRGRPFEKSANPSVGEVTSPPREKVTPGRYNRSDEPVLYLSRTERTAHIESDPDGSKKVWLLEFAINRPDLEYIELDTDFEEKYPYLHHLLLLSEILPKHRDEPTAYRPTQFLHYICKENSVQAIEFPSIRAEYAENPCAVNLVVFESDIPAIESQVVNGPYISPCEEYSGEDQGES